MTELRIAVLGSGYMGRTYAECLTRYNQRCALVAISGGSRAPALAHDYHVPHEVTYDALLARTDVDAVVIATPPVVHSDQAIHAVQYGKHVLVEKPMAISVAQCTAMIEASRQAGVVLEVIQTLRFRSALIRAKEAIDSGKLGPVWMIRGQSLRHSNPDYTATKTGLPYQGGPILDMGVHNFDLMRFLTGAEAKQVFGHVCTYGNSQEPGLSALVQIHFDQGIVAQQWISFEFSAAYMTESQHRYVIHGEKGVLDIDGYGKVYLAQEDKWELLWKQPQFDFINDPLNPNRLEAFYTQTQTFIDDILDGRPPTVPGEDGRAAVAIAEAAWESMRTGSAVSVT